MKPSYSDALNAVATLISWIGDDPKREQLLKTPERVLSAYKILFRGYQCSVEDVIKSSVFPNDGCKDMIIIKNIDFLSYCEHHIVPFVGKVNVAYVPDNFIIGIGKVVEVIHVFASRLQIQERFTLDVANALNQFVSPFGIAVSVSAKHGCVFCQGGQDNLSMQTNHMMGVFSNNSDLRKEFFLQIGEK